MKDSKGREYDGWVFKSKDSSLYTWTFKRTRRELHGADNDYSTWGLKAVKVRIVEVVE